MLYFRVERRSDVVFVAVVEVTDVTTFVGLFLVVDAVVFVVLTS